MSARLLYRVLAVVVIGILALAPFHALLTTWAGSTFGAIDVWRIWKEMLLVLSIPFAIYLLGQDKGFRAWLVGSTFARLVWAYVALYVAAGVVAWFRGVVDGDALLYAYFSNLRFLVFFVIAALVARRVPWIRRRALVVVLIGGGVVVLFGLAQLLVLPYDALTFFGYGPDTIPAFQTVDEKLEYQRIQSTLRGANPLGAFLVVYLGLLAAYIGRFWRRWWYWGLMLATVAVLFFSYSRSGYIGAMITLSLLGAMQLPHSMRRLVAIIGAILLLVGAGTVFMLRDNAVIQNTLFHTDETSHSSISSNESRLRALQQGVNDLVNEPFGRGPGTAGPASTRNEGGARISENYFIQIGQEIGWPGVILVSSIMAYAGLLLWQRRSDPLARALIASLVGLTVVNLVSHAWTDDTLGLMWWGLAGIALGGYCCTSTHDSDSGRRPVVHSTT